MAPRLEELETHRKAIYGHCYRMLGSVVDADDAVQETMVRAWKGLEGFDGRSSPKTWLYRIATNVCIDALGAKKRRFRPMDEAAPGTPEDAIDSRPREHWLEPVPTSAILADDATPDVALVQRESVRLAFVSALQSLPPKPRAALLLTDVVGLSADEAASCLETSVASVTSALQRARATLSSPPLPEPERLDAGKSALLERYVAAFHAYDVEALVSLVREDVTFNMPPIALWLSSREHVRAWLLGRGAGCRGSRLLPIDVAGAPGFAQYRANPEGGHVAWGAIVLDVREGAIASWTTFLDVETLFPRFGLPLELPAE